MTTTREIMSKDCQCIGEHDSVQEAAHRLAELKVGAMPICGDDDRLKGMLTDRDITVKVVAEGKDPSRTEAGELAEGTPVWIDADAELDRALKLMAEHDIRRLPVIEEHRLVGIISQADIARRLGPAEAGSLVEAISSAPPNN
jgi:CBS domain-containing protein